MSADGFRLDIFSEARADVYLALPDGADVPWPLVRRLDEAGIRVVGDLPDLAPDEARVRRIVGGCSGVVGDEPAARRAAAEFGLPHCEASPNGDMPDAELAFCGAVARVAGRVPPYAFFVGRLERDFAQAREAIRVAVEREAGISFLWVDDGRHRVNLEGVRERTRLLLRYASFVIADLTLGVENPDRENPSRAHEIGMAIAYERPVMLCSQEPRRYPYYSIGDMQMAFWETEDELESRVCEWTYARREAVGRRVFNHELASREYQPRLAPPVFQFDPMLRYVGPKTRVARSGIPAREERAGAAPAAVPKPGDAAPRPA